MATTLNFTRKLVNGAWDINHRDRLESDANQKHLAYEIRAVVGVDSRMVCDGEKCELVFEKDLTQAQIDAVSKVVAEHQANL